jgi:CheY-like chemotaxis protein
MKLKNIFLVEDDKINALAFKKGLTKLTSDNHLIVLETAEEALELLRGPENNPNIIILDLNLPGMSGVDFLKIIKKDPVMKKIPVIVLTTSMNPQDKVNCFELQVAGYFVKPIDYFELIRSVYFYWSNSEFPESLKKVHQD